MNTNPKAKRILCYGDSYTWGYVPDTNHQRLPSDKRWTGLLQINLGDNFEIIEEGLNSRTLNSKDARPGKEGRNGKEYLIPCLDSHDPVDLVILVLGTNELKDSFDTTIEEIGKIIEEDYVQVILNRKSQFRDTTPQLLLISPPLIDNTKEYAKQRYSNSKVKNKALASLYEKISIKNNCYFLDSSQLVKVGTDGVHLDADNHKKLGEVITEKALNVFRGRK
ncbi:MAG TPA: GDSL-type esterase/lipase family protein [Candidatus Bathyarchaeia archaeon]|nr:GDSL-type esterase/lipase family protein [Candidatus Bathyarchaeia archaeon]